MRFLPLVLPILCAFQAASAQESCIDLFALKPAWQQAYDDVVYDAAEKDVPESAGLRTMKIGFAQMMGRRPNTPPPAHEVVGRLEYNITNNMLILTSWRGRPEFEGQSVFISLMRMIFNRHPELKTVVTSLSGAHFDLFQKDLAWLRDERQALQMNPVYQRLADLGYPHIRALHVMQSPGSASFLRISVSDTAE